MDLSNLGIAIDQPIFQISLEMLRIFLAKTFHAREKFSNHKVAPCLGVRLFTFLLCFHYKSKRMNLIPQPFSYSLFQEKVTAICD